MRCGPPRLHPPVLVCQLHKRHPRPAAAAARGLGSRGSLMSPMLPAACFLGPRLLTQGASPSMSPTTAGSRSSYCTDPGRWEPQWRQRPTSVDLVRAEAAGAAMHGWVLAQQPPAEAPPPWREPWRGHGRRLLRGCGRASMPLSFQPASQPHDLSICITVSSSPLLSQTLASRM